jgi:hypothetical protein
VNDVDLIHDSGTSHQFKNLERSITFESNINFFRLISLH